MAIYNVCSKYGSDNLFISLDTGTTPAKLRYSIDNVTWAEVTASVDLSNYYTKTQTDTAITNAISTSLTSVFVYKGSVGTVSALPQTNNKSGDVYHVTANSAEYVWDGISWEELSGEVYILPTASTTTLGGVKVDGTTIQISETGVISSIQTSYNLPTASTTTLGGVKVDGTSVTINSGVISVPNAITNPVKGYASGYIIRKLTQSEYNALSTKDPNTFYFIVG